MSFRGAESVRGGETMTTASPQMTTVPQNAVTPAAPITSQPVNTTMETGIVKWFNNAKGWGFISRDDDGSDVFVHYSQIEGDGYRTLRQGQVVRFVLKQGPRGQFAEQVLL